MVGQCLDLMKKELELTYCSASKTKSRLTWLASRHTRQGFRHCEEGGGYVIIVEVEESLVIPDSLHLWYKQRRVCIYIFICIWLKKMSGARSIHRFLVIIAG